MRDSSFSFCEDGFSSTLYFLQFPNGIHVLKLPFYETHFPIGRISLTYKEHKDLPITLYLLFIWVPIGLFCPLHLKHLYSHTPYTKNIISKIFTKDPLGGVKMGACVCTHQPKSSESSKWARIGNIGLGSIMHHIEFSCYKINEGMSRHLSLFSIQFS